MKIIFTSPFNPLWSNSVSELASLLDAKVVSIGDLLRAEVKCESELGKEIEANLQRGEILRPDLVGDLLSLRFSHDSANRVLVNYPRNTLQAVSLAKSIQTSAYGLDACVVVNTSKESTIEKFESQFHCIDSLHPKRETLENSPECEICGKTMIHSYDLENDKVAALIDSYFDENGALSGGFTLSRFLGVEAIPYTTSKEVVNQVQGLSHENV
jgi:adenylate kinase